MFAWYLRSRENSPRKRRAPVHRAPVRRPSWPCSARSRGSCSMSTSPGSISSSSPSQSAKRGLRRPGRNDRGFRPRRHHTPATPRRLISSDISGSIRGASPTACRLAIGALGLAGGFADRAELKRAAIRAVLGGVRDDEIAAWTDRFVAWCLPAWCGRWRGGGFAAHRGRRAPPVLPPPVSICTIRRSRGRSGSPTSSGTKVGWTRDAGSPATRRRPI